MPTFRRGYLCRLPRKMFSLHITTWETQIQHVVTVWETDPLLRSLGTITFGRGSTGGLPGNNSHGILRESRKLRVQEGMWLAMGRTSEDKES